MKPTLEVVALVVIAAAGAAVVTLTRHRPSWRRARIGIIGTTATLVGFAAAYFWLFERGPCDGDADVACMMNANQGVLTFLAFVYAGVGLWTAAISHWENERRVHLSEVDATRHALIAATGECSHNLIHAGSAWHDDGWHGFFPQLTVSGIPLLLEPEFRKHLHPTVVSQADAIVRNWAALRDIEPGWAVPPDSYEPTDPPNRYMDFLSRSMLLLITAISHHPTWCHESLREKRLNVLQEAANFKKFRFTTLTSESQDDAATIRVEDVPIVCWWDDQPIKGVTTYEIGPAFKDLAQGHRH